MCTWFQWDEFHIVKGHLHFGIDRVVDFVRDVIIAESGFLYFVLFQLEILLNSMEIKGSYC